MDAETEAQIARSFRRYDTNCDGVITRGELLRVLQTLDPNTWSDEKVNLLLQAADINGDGSIQYDEFVGWIMGKTAARHLSEELSLAGATLTPFQAAPTGPPGFSQAAGPKTVVKAGSDWAAQVERDGAIAGAFRRFDANRDGVISSRELATVLQSLDPVAWSDGKVEALLRVVDANADGRIQYREFLAWVNERSAAQELAGTLASNPFGAATAGAAPAGIHIGDNSISSRPALMAGHREEQVAAAFSRFDVNGDGVICRKELTGVLQRLDPQTWTDAMCCALLQAADTNQDGKIQYNEFIRWAFDSGSITSSELASEMGSELHLLEATPRQPDAIVVEVHLISGQVLTSVPLSPMDPVATLSAAVSQELGGRQCRLTLGATPLASHATLIEAGLSHGAVVTAVLTGGIVQMVSNIRGAYAATKADGSVVTWGCPEAGGDSSAVAERLRDGVRSTVVTESAFCALKADGSVVTWGRASHGGSAGHDLALQLSSEVIQVFSTSEAFCALKSSGSVVTWGNLQVGPASEHLTSDVTHVVTNHLAFCALKSSGAVVTWGSGWCGGGDLGIVTNLRGPCAQMSVAHQLQSEVIQLFSTSSAFCGLKAGGAVVAWGDAAWGGDISAVAEQLGAGVRHVVTNDCAFAALKEDGRVVTWGEPTAGGNLDVSVSEQLHSGVVRLTPSSEAFVALKADGSVIAWGSANAGGELPPALAVDPGSRGGVRDIVATEGAFAALRGDGSVVCWGRAEEGGDLTAGGLADPLVIEQLQRGGVAQIFANDAAFAALLEDNRSLICWGASGAGGDPGIEVKAELAEGVAAVVTARNAFAATKADGSVVLWGSGVNDAAALQRLQPYFRPAAAG